MLDQPDHLLQKRVEIDMMMNDTVQFGLNADTPGLTIEHSYLFQSYLDLPKSASIAQDMFPDAFMTLRTRMALEITK